MNWYIAVLRKYADFSGRARRQEYWMFALFNALITLVFCVLMFVPMLFLQHSDSGAIGGVLLLFMIPFWLYNLAILIPSFAVSVRRLHDVGKSGLWLLIAFVPFVGGIILLVFHCMDSEPGPNLYGPSPKYGGGPGGGYPPYPPPYPPVYPPPPPSGY